MWLCCLEPVGTEGGVRLQTPSKYNDNKPITPYKLRPDLSRMASDESVEFYSPTGDFLGRESDMDEDAVLLGDETAPFISFVA